MAGREKRGSRPPWVGLAAAVWVEISAGSAQTFALYSHSLKSVLGLTQQQLTILGVANDIGENVGILPGVVCNRLPPWIILLIAAACSFFGFGAIWLTLSQTIPALPYLLVFIALCFGTNSSAWMGTAVLVTNMRNFPLSRGTVAGIMKGYMGLSGAVFTLAYIGALQTSSKNFLLFLTVGIPFICILMMYFVRPCIPSLEDDTIERKYFLAVQISSVVLGVYLLLTTSIIESLSVSNIISYVLVGVMALIILTPILIPLKMTVYPARSIIPSNLDTSNLPGSTDHTKALIDKDDIPLPDETPFLGDFMETDESFDIDLLYAEGEGAVKKKRPRRGEDFSFREAVVKADFWLLFMSYFLAVGSGVTVLNNLAQIGTASGIDDTTILLSLFSFFNFFGRLVGGVVSEHFVRKSMLPRPFWMLITQLLMIVIYLLFAFGSKALLYFSTGLLGICYGVQFSVMVPTASELFGLKHFGIIYNFMILGNPLGAILFSGILAGYVYDTEAKKQQGEGAILNSSVSCLGPNCFQLTFEILAGVCVLGSILTTILTMRVKPVYQALYASGSFRIPHH